MTISIGLSLDPQIPWFLDLARQAERLGIDSVWVPEFWGYDAFTPLAAIAAVTDRIRLATGIAQLGARTPAMLAMSAMSVQAISAGRFVLGIGTSGPQVIEGWHAVDFSRPIQRTRETIEIVRAVVARERLRYDGQVFQIPRPGGEGVALRTVAHVEPFPIHIASLGPKNLALTGELADGWIGNSFFPEQADAYFGPIGEAAERAGRSFEDLEMVVAASVEFTDDVTKAGRRHADGYAFTFGAMGSNENNFYNNAFSRLGYGDDVREVQRLWAAGERGAAAARVPIEIGLGTNLLGPPDTVRERLRTYRDCGVKTLRVGPTGRTLDEQVAALGTLMDLVADLQETR